jgi:hypothetical protein
MNLVDFVKEQLTPELASKLGALAGTSDVQTKSGIAAAVPALLAAFSGAAAKGGSAADKLAAAVNRVDLESERSLATEPGRAVDEGSNLLSSALGEGTLSGVVNAISKYARLEAGTAKKLIAGLVPLVMGAIARQFKGEPVSGRGLANLLADQRANIADALPAGLSLAGIPDLPPIGEATRAAVDATQRTAQRAASGGTRVLATVIPLALIAGAAFLAWQYFSRRPAEVQEPNVVTQTANKPVSPLPDSLPDVTKFSEDLTSTYTTATETLGQVKDAESAKAALPELEKLQANLDSLQTTWDQLPATAKPAVSAITEGNIGKLKELVAQLLTQPEIKNVLQPILDAIVAKLEAFKN